MYAVFDRHSAAVHAYRSWPQEDPKLVIPHQCFERHVQTIKGHIQGKVSELVCNLNEVESAEWKIRET
jgi:hypothetical protein